MVYTFATKSSTRPTSQSRRVVKKIEYQTAMVHSNGKGWAIGTFSARTWPSRWAPIAVPSISVPCVGGTTRRALLPNVPHASNLPAGFWMQTERYALRMYWTAGANALARSPCENRSRCGTDTYSRGPRLAALRGGFRRNRRRNLRFQNHVAGSATRCPELLYSAAARCLRAKQGGRGLSILCTRVRSGHFHRQTYR
eukprot:scaffold1653_cov389-Prasinococcus_capsulatus_cf.AAC.16